MAYYDDRDKVTEIWHRYELGKAYNNSLSPNQYDLVNTNIEFFIGNQWKGLANNSAMASLPKPVFNIIKRITSLFVASLTSSSTKVSLEPLENKQTAPVSASMMPGQPQTEEEEAQTAAQMATSEIENLWDKLKMDFRIRDAMFDGAQTGDYCAHFYWDANKKPYGGAYGAYRGEIQMELVDGINVMFGNPNTSNKEAQPYILIIGRDTVKNLRDEYLRQHPGDEEGARAIRPDADYEYQAGSGGKVELGRARGTAKATFIYCYEKKTKEVKLTNPDGTPKMEPVLGEDNKPKPKLLDGMPMFDVMGSPIYEQEQAKEMRTTVFVSKAVQSANIYTDIDTGLTYYPIAWGNYERQKNQYHGRALVTGIIPNQIYINSMFALIMRHQQMLGFPKTLYDANVIGQWSNAVGQAIAVYDLPPDKRMSDLHSVIQPADMSTQIMQCIEKAVQYTKECLGATDAQLGNVRPDNTSALIALQSSSQVPLENPQANKHEWVEDIGQILIDMMATYYGKRPVVRHTEIAQQTMDPATGQPTTEMKKVKVVEMYDFNKLKDLWLNVRVDVGPSTYWSRIAIVQTLDNLFQAGILDTIDYLERMPGDYVPQKDELISKLRTKMSQPPAGAEQGMPPEMGGAPEQGAPMVAAGTDAKGSEAAILASMPSNMQTQFSTMGNRVQSALKQQAQNTMIGV